MNKLPVLHTTRLIVLLISMANVLAPFTVDAQQKQFRMVRDIPFNNERLAYQIAVEKGWAFVAMKGDVEFEENGLTLIGRYFAEKTDQVLPPELRIRAVRIDQPESAQSFDWISEHYAKYDVSIDKTNFKSQFISDLGISFVAKKTPFSGRSMIKIVENRLFLVECVAQESTFSTITENCATAFRSFAVNTVDKPILKKEKSST